MISECPASNLFLESECKVDHNDPIPVKCEFNISIKHTYQLSSWNLKKHMDNKTKIDRDQETHYITVCTKFEAFILIHEAMNIRTKPSLSPFRS